MKITVIGTGYVGLVTGTCFSDLGNEVYCYDINEEKIKTLNKGTVPFYEQGLKELMDRNTKLNRLKFTTDEKVIGEAEVVFICVGTPPKKDGEADLTQIEAVAKTISKNLSEGAVVVIKSTVPAGTGDLVKRIIKKGTDKKFYVASNPEFLREGAAVKDFQLPDRVVIGVDSKKAKEVLELLYKPLSRADKPLLVTNIKTSELIKYASNAMLATRISFMNEISYLCEEHGADIKEVAKGMGLDNRIGPRFLQAGAGYGGSCFPKDVRALSQMLEQKGHPSNLLRSVDYINERQKKSVVTRLKKLIGELEGKTIAIWGLSFKPKTDDIRESTALTVVNNLLKEYAIVKVYDPEAMDNFRKEYSDIKYCKDAYETVEDADALLLLTEWDEFRSPDFDRIKKLMKKPVLLDGRNIYSTSFMKEKGFIYKGIGRS